MCLLSVTVQFVTRLGWILQWRGIEPLRSVTNPWVTVDGPSLVLVHCRQPPLLDHDCLGCVMHRGQHFRDPLPVFQPYVSPLLFHSDPWALKIVMYDISVLYLSLILSILCLTQLNSSKLIIILMILVKSWLSEQKGSHSVRGVGWKVMRGRLEKLGVQWSEHTLCVWNCQQIQYRL